MVEPDILSRIIQSTVSTWQSEARAQWVEISGTSMWPLLHSGDHVCVTFGNSTCKPGQLALFRLNGTNIVHRIIHIENDVLTLRGDNRLVADPQIAQNNIIGLITARRRFGRILPLNTSIGILYAKACLLTARTKCHIGSLLRQTGLHN